MPKRTLNLKEKRPVSGSSKSNSLSSIDPATPQTVARSTGTFAELAEEYLTRHAKPKKKSWKEDGRTIARELLPVWKQLKAKEIAPSDVTRLLDTIVNRGSPIQANRTLTLARKIFNFGIQRDLVMTNPCGQIPAPSPERRRNRILTPDELRVLWKRFSQEPGTELTPFKLMLLTAQRPGQVIAMRWKHIDLDSAWWTIPVEEAKNGVPHRVPLVRAAVAALKIAKVAAGNSEWVFPGRRWIDPAKRKGRENVKETLKELRRATGIEFRPHDLRITVARLMTNMGVSAMTVSKLLNKAIRARDVNYDRRPYDSEKRVALNLWSEYLSGLAKEK